MECCRLLDSDGIYFWNLLTFHFGLAPIPMMIGWKDPVVVWCIRDANARCDTFIAIASDNIISQVEIWPIKCCALKHVSVSSLILEENKHSVVKELKMGSYFSPHLFPDSLPMALLSTERERERQSVEGGEKMRDRTNDVLNLYVAMYFLPSRKPSQTSFKRNWALVHLN